jgi:hypothetical protein
MVGRKKEEPRGRKKDRKSLVKTEGGWKGKEEQRELLGVKEVEGSKRGWGERGKRGVGEAGKNEGGWIEKRRGGVEEEEED